MRVASKLFEEASMKMKPAVTSRTSFDQQQLDTLNVAWASGLTLNTEISLKGVANVGKPASNNGTAQAPGR